MANKVLRIALLNCERLKEHLNPQTYALTGGYFELLSRTFDHVSSGSTSNGLRVELTDFDAKGGQFPKEPRDFDGVLISGSLSGVYDNEKWISQLLDEIRRYQSLQVRTCGISFGHQAIAEALGGKVSRNPKGSEVSVRNVALTEAAKKYFGTGKQSFKLLYHHNDTIVRMPPGFEIIGGNNVTQFQGMFKGKTFLSFCGHPDYSHYPLALEALLHYDREKLWVPEQLIELGLQSVREPTDYEWITKQIMKFYAGKLGL